MAYQQPTGGGQQAEFGGQTPGQQSGTGTRLQDVESPQQRAALDGIARAIAVCEHCADQCIQLGDPNMTECIRLCEDVAELGETATVLLPRNSRHAWPVLGTLERAIQACRQECGQHGHAHCQECAAVLGDVQNALQQFRGSVGGPQGATQGMGMTSPGFQ